VLPFMTSGEATNAIRLMAEMVTDDLTNLLSRSPSFRVISRQTARRFAGQPADVAAIGAELEIRYVLESNLRLQDGKLRVNVELINPASRLPVWAGRIERDDADQRGVRDEIVARLAREMQFEILPIESARGANDMDTDALAYRGWATLSEPNPEGYERARLLFEEVLARDPQNLFATIGLGAYHARMGAQVYDADPIGHRAKAAQILREAARRDPQSSEAQSVADLAGGARAFHARDRARPEQCERAWADRQRVDPARPRGGRARACPLRDAAFAARSDHAGMARIFRQRRVRAEELCGGDRSLPSIDRAQSQLPARLGGPRRRACARRPQR